MSTTGTVTAVSKSVIEVMFDDLPPAVGEVVLIDALKAKLVTETILEDGTVLCLNVENNTSIVRGMEVTATGGGLQIPVGNEMIGRIVDAFGHPLDGLGEIHAKASKDILKVTAHTTVRVNAKPEILETGIKVVDFFAPFVKGRKIGIIGGAGVGKTVLMMELVASTVIVE